MYDDHASSNIIGWKEYVDFPQWKIRHMRAKIDTGARTSALHVEDLAFLSGDRVRFHVVVNAKSPRRIIPVTARIVRRGRVMSSSGHSSKRVFVETDLVLAGTRQRVELSLVDRGHMAFRLLLGRTSLDNGLAIDVRRAYVTGKSRKGKRPVKKRKATS